MTFGPDNGYIVLLAFIGWLALWAIGAALYDWLKRR
jgi:hypothetical protein